MISHDSLNESDKHYNSKGMFLTNAQNFNGTIGYITENNQHILLIKSAKESNYSKKNNIKK